MFIRKKKNPSGVISIQVIDKSGRRYKVIKTIGSSSDEKTIAKLYQQGKKWIASYDGEKDMFILQEQKEEEEQIAKYLLSNIENILLNGPQLILNRVYRIVGFEAIDDDILKHLVIARLCQPSSKAGTVAYLKSYFDKDILLHKIYRYMDTLNEAKQEAIQKISVEHTQKILGGRIGLVFYDVTTLYFETDVADDFRKTGFSKEGRHWQPQIVLGLLASEDGYPLAYSLHEGSKYEGHTMLPVIEDFAGRFNLSDFVIVADSGLMSSDNIALLEERNYKYIIGARIKNEGKAVAQWILSHNKADGVFFEYQKTENRRLVVGYSGKRAKKDAYNREKGIRRLEKDFIKGAITKDKINKRGYNKFLEISNGIKAKINYEKVKEDERWDGLKGCVTNTSLPAKQIFEQYRCLWQIERAFRISKGTLELRPVFHFTKKRIDAHVCICFAAYKVYKEFERILKAGGINISVDSVLSIAKTITTMKIRLPVSGETIEKTMLLTQKHKSIAILFNENFWKDF